MSLRRVKSMLNVYLVCMSLIRANNYSFRPDSQEMWPLRGSQWLFEKMSLSWVKLVLNILSVCAHEGLLWYIFSENGH